MILPSSSLFSHFGRRLRAALVVVVGFFSSALLSHASKLLLYSPPGGPMEYNQLGGILTDAGWVTKVSFNFEVPEAVRIQKIRAWINGPDWGTATFSVSTVADAWGDWLAPVSYLSTFPVETVSDAPAKWQGVDSLKWDLHLGTYQFFMAAPDVPIGYGYYGPTPNLDSVLDTFDYKDYSQPDDIPWAPFGLEVYGVPLSAVPEPSFYGLMGAAGLLALAASRRVQRKVRRGAADRGKRPVACVG